VDPDGGADHGHRNRGNREDALRHHVHEPLGRIVLAVSRLDLGPNLGTRLGPEFFNGLLAYARISLRWRFLYTGIYRPVTFRAMFRHFCRLRARDVMATESIRPRRSRWLWLLPLPLAAAAGAAAFWLLPHRPSVVLITIDALRPDRLGAYGHTNNRTPAIDRLAREGMLFETAYCDMPWTTGSMSSVMTGQYSSSHGVQLPTTKLKPEAVTMAEILLAEGYQTGAVVASFPLDSVYGLDQGFETYSDEFSMPMIATADTPVEHVESRSPEGDGTGNKATLKKFQNDAYRPDEDVTDAAIHWLETIRGDRPFFLWVHYFGPHEKLRGDVGFVDQEPAIVKAYDPDVEAADRAVGRFVDRLRSLELLDETLLVVHADHGQNLGEQGFVGHGLRIDEATVRIPLILRYPARIRAGLRRVDTAHNVDILPTVLAAVGLKNQGPAGRSLLPSHADPRGAYTPADQQIAYFETLLPAMIHVPLLVPQYWTVLGPVKRSGLRTPEWRFVNDQVVGACNYGGTPHRDPFGAWILPDAKPLEASKCEKIQSTMLYAVSSLGDREPDVSKQHPDVVAKLATLLQQHAEQKADLASQFNLSPVQQEKLRSLGYLK